jgi:hypothetical protein
MENSMNWRELTTRLDYHHGKWYEHNGYWCLIHKDRAYNIICELYPDQDPYRTMRQFAYRDRESHARPKHTKAQLEWRLI